MASNRPWYTIHWWMSGKSLDVYLGPDWALKYNWYHSLKWPILDALRHAQ